MRSKKVVLNVLSTLFLQVVTVLYGFIVPKIIISNYGSNVNGLISSITQFLAYITLLESGFGPVVKSILYKPISKNDNNTIGKILKASESFFRKISFVFIMYIIVLCVFYPLIINNNFSTLYTISLIAIIAISTFSEYFFGMTYKLFLQADQKSYIISIVQIFTYIVCILLIVILAKFNCSIQVIKLATAFAFVLRPIIQNTYVRKKYNINLKKYKNDYKIKNKWDGLAQHIAYVIHGNTDITILTFFSSLSEISVYSIYIMVVNGVKSIIRSFSSSIDSTFGDMLAHNETENLNKKFNDYEVLYNTICVIVFSCTLFLIVPFISVYTTNIKDANYIRYIFGYLIVISEYIWALMQPYSQLTIAAGHFKQTRNGAWVEALINIILSLILVNKYGIVGVAIGTIVAVGVRAIEYLIYSNKFILKRKIKNSLYKIIISIVETVVILILLNEIFSLESKTYLSWILLAIKSFIITTLIVLFINYIFYKKAFLNIVAKLKSLIKIKK